MHNPASKHAAIYRALRAHQEAHAGPGDGTSYSSEHKN